ncbi:MAG: hypothetical protein RIC19_02510 [Phaeodactylibacter sp.]
MNKVNILSGLFLLPIFLLAQQAQFAVRVAPDLHQQTVDGRLLILLSTNPDQEPRFQITDDSGTQQVFGIDVEGWAPGVVQRVGREAYGYPVEAMPYYDGEVAYGDRAEHCWNGDPEEPNHISRLRYHRMFIQKWVAEDMPKVAPEGADLDSWRY